MPCHSPQGKVEDYKWTRNGARPDQILCIRSYVMLLLNKPLKTCISLLRGTISGNYDIGGLQAISGGADSNDEMYRCWINIRS